MSESEETPRTALAKRLEASPAYKLWLASNAWIRVIQRVLAPFGITHVQYILLAAIDVLSETQEQVTQVAVCRFAGVDPNMV